MMNRRTFLCGLALGTLAAPLAAGAQQAGKIPRIGVLVTDARRGGMARLRLRHQLASTMATGRSGSRNGSNG